MTSNHESVNDIPETDLDDLRVLPDSSDDMWLKHLKSRRPSRVVSLDYRTMRGHTRGFMEVGMDPAAREAADRFLSQLSSDESIECLRCAHLLPAGSDAPQEQYSAGEHQVLVKAQLLVQSILLSVERVATNKTIGKKTYAEFQKLPVELKKQDRALKAAALTMPDQAEKLRAVCDGLVHIAQTWQASGMENIMMPKKIVSRLTV